MHRPGITVLPGMVHPLWEKNIVLKIRLSIDVSTDKLGEGNGNPLQYSCLENPMNKGALWATVHRIAKSQTQLSDWACTCTHAHTHTHTPEKLASCFREQFSGIHLYINSADLLSGRGGGTTETKLLEHLFNSLLWNIIEISSSFSVKILTPLSLYLLFFCSTNLLLAFQKFLKFSKLFHPFSFLNWRRKWQPIPIFLPEKSHGQRSLVSYSPWGCKELDTTEQFHFHFFFFISWWRCRFILYEMFLCHLKNYVAGKELENCLFHNLNPNAILWIFQEKLCDLG